VSMDKKLFAQIIDEATDRKRAYLDAVAQMTAELDTLGNVYPLTTAQTKQMRELVALKAWASENANRIMWGQEDEE